MKKITNRLSTFFMILIVLIGGVLFTACSNKGSEGFEVFQNTIYSHLVIKEGNKTIENFRLNYSLAEWSTEQEKADFIQESEMFFETFSNMLDTHYKTLLAEKEISVENLPSKFTSVSKDNSNIIIVASFPNKKIWEEVSVKDGFVAGTKTKTSLFTHTVTDTIEKVGSAIKVGTVDYFIGDFFFEEVVKFLQENNYNNVLDSSQIKNVFAYAAENKKLKSDAEQVSILEGKYFHFWNITDVEDVRISFSVRHARVEVWYLFAIVLALLSVSVVFFISYFKDLIAFRKSKVLKNNESSPENAEDKTIEKQPIETYKDEQTVTRETKNTESPKKQTAEPKKIETKKIEPKKTETKKTEAKKTETKTVKPTQKKAKEKIDNTKENEKATRKTTKKED